MNLRLERISSSYYCDRKGKNEGANNDRRKVDLLTWKEDEIKLLVHKAISATMLLKHSGHFLFTILWCF